VPPLPERPNLEHLKKQAKDLLRLYHRHDPDAFHRLRTSLPAAKDKDDDALTVPTLRLHDAQSCVAREYGFASWGELRTYLERGRTDDPSHLLHRWLVFVYGHRDERPRPAVAVRMLEEKPELVASDSILACAVGNVAALQNAVAHDRNWVNRTPSLTCPECGTPLGRPPLVAVTHSSLGRLERFRDRLRSCTRLLLEAGADANQTWSEDDYHSQSALYGAAGKNHDPEFTAMLLSAGANPDDGESLYHSVEARDLKCTRLLLGAGAKVDGTNALHHQLDTENLEGFNLLLSHTKDPNDASSSLGAPLLWAIRRGRSRAHVEALLDAGANPHARNTDGVSAYRLALQNGLVDVADALLQAGASEPLSLEDQFVAACARSDKAEALRILGARPDIINLLSEGQLRQLPNLTEAGKSDAVRLMVELGWPVAVRGGDWDASALNLAVFRGDSGLTRFLLDHGARWTERHGHDDDVRGTLAWASRNNDPDHADWVGCAKALVEHGLPVLEMDGDYSDDVAAFLATERARSQRPHV
jgi:hypothetical protein